MENGMKSLFKLSILSLLAACIFSGCDVVPYKDAYEVRNFTPDTGTAEIARQVVLLEDFTGHTCGNCPTAHAEAKRLGEKYKDRLIIMSLHIGFYAKPKNTANGSYKEDFRTPVGDALESQFNVEPAGLPKGLINRRRFNGSSLSILNSTDWEARIVQILEGTSPGIKIEMTPVFNTGNGVLNVQSKLTFQKGYEGKLKAAMYVTEDSVINWQKIYGNNPEDVQYYVHRHVLRTDMRIEGDNNLLNGGSNFDLNQILTHNWNTQLASKIKPNKCHIVLVLFNPDNNEIIQAGEVKLVTN